MGQAREAGLRQEKIRTLVRSGQWEALASGVYGLVGVPATFRRRAMAIALVGGPESVISHWSAATLLGITGHDHGRRAAGPTPIHLSLPRGRNSRSARGLDAVVHRPTVLTSQDRVEVEGIPLTRPARLLVDMAAELDGPEFENLVDDLFFTYRLTADRVLGTLERVGPRAGGPALRAAITPWLTGPQPGSPPEIRLQRRLVEAGLGPPVRQYEVLATDGTFIARPDLAYTHASIAIEYLGQRWHRPRRTAHDERRRQKMIVAGWTPLDAYDEDTRRATCGPFVEVVARLLHERGARRGAWRAGRDE